MMTPVSQRPGGFNAYYSGLYFSPFPVKASGVQPGNNTGVVGLSHPLSEKQLIEKKLGNGTQAYFLQKPELRKSAILVSIPLGGLPPGASYFLLKMLRETYKQRMEEWGQLGLDYSSHTLSSHQDEMQVVFKAEAPVGQESVMGQALKDVFARPVVDPALLKAQKGQFIQRKQAQMTDPDHMLDTAMAIRLFGPGHPYSLTPRERIADAAAQDVRSVMACQPAMLQALSQGRIMMVSPLPVEAQIMGLDAAFNSPALKVGGFAGRNDVGRIDRVKPGPRPAVLVPNETLERALIKVFWQVPDQRDPDYPAFCLIQSLLKGNSQNSFFQLLRTKHALTYGLNPKPVEYQLPIGDTFIPGVKVRFADIGQALADIRETTQRLCRQPLSATELQALQRETQLAMREGMETPGELLSLFDPWLSRPGARVPGLAEMWANVSRVTPADIQRVANRVFNDPNTIRLMAVSAPKQVLQQWFPGQPLATLDNK